MGHSERVYRNQFSRPREEVERDRLRLEWVRWDTAMLLFCISLGAHLATVGRGKPGPEGYPPCRCAGCLCWRGGA